MRFRSCTGPIVSASHGHHLNVRIGPTPTEHAIDQAVLDVCTYALVPGAAAEFERLFRGNSLLLLETFGIRTVAFGPSVGDPERYLLVLAFRSELERVNQLEAFYSNSAWAEGEAVVLPLIESFHQFVVPIPSALVIRWA